jgi:hypothetical protein
LEDKNLFDLSKDSIVISGSLHRAISDKVNELVGDNINWRENYHVRIGLEGQILARAATTSGLNSLDTGIMQKIAAIPTGPWVKNSDQEWYLCLFSEQPELMQLWWTNYVRGNL